MIRLQRRGTHKKPFYRLVINEKTKTPKSSVLEFLGTYNPHTKDFSVKEDRLLYWISVGAQCSATINNLLIDKKIIKGDKVRSWAPKKKEPTEEELKQAEEAKKAVAEKKVAEAKLEEKVEEPKKTEDKPAEELKKEEKPKEKKEEVAESK